MSSFVRRAGTAVACAAMAAATGLAGPATGLAGPATEPAGRPAVLAGPATDLTTPARPAGAPAAEVTRPPTLARAAGDGTRYGPPRLVCQTRDGRLGAVSGVAPLGGRLYVQNDTVPVRIDVVDPRCTLVDRVTLTIPPLPGAAPPAPRSTAPGAPAAKSYDVEDLQVAQDGALWLADTGGNTGLRRVVSLYRWPGSGVRVQRFNLRYPDRPRDAEALLLSFTGQAVIVTKEAGGRSAVYTAPLPLAEHATLTRVADLDVRALRAAGDTGPRSLLVTGGAVSPDGAHFVLRTYTAAYEWDTPDGDVLAALRRGTPRVVRLADEPQGEAIAYTEDGRRLLTLGERLPASLYEIPITRAAAAEKAGPAAGRLPLAAGAAAVLLVGAAWLLGRERRRLAHPVTYQSVG